MFGDSQTRFGDSQTLLGDSQTLFGDSQTLLGDSQTLFGDSQTSFGDSQMSFCDSRTSFVRAPSISTVTGPQADLTIDHLKQKEQRLYSKLLAWSCVKAASTLATAKAAMESTPGCTDIFVTESGNSQEPVLGWITNVKIGHHSRA